MDLFSLDIDALLGFGDDSNPLMMLVWILPIILFVFYGQRIQLMVTSGDIRKNIKKLDSYGVESRAELVEYVRAVIARSGAAAAGSGAAESTPAEGEEGGRPDSGGAPSAEGRPAAPAAAATAAALGPPGGGIAERIDTLLDYFTIMPADMDPSGIVPKIEHVVRSREDLTRAHVRSLCPEMSDGDLSRVQTLLEIATVLRLLYRAVNHLYLTAKKQKNFPLILPLQMALPFIMEQATAMHAAVPAFKAGQPVGDGIGPMVVGSMMVGLEKKEAAFQTVVAKGSLGGRTAYLLKAEGPASTVGRPGEAVESLVAGARPDMIIMVDAALKMEGEESASIAQGFGAAIGGIGTERFRIERAAAAGGIPVLAIVVKQSAKEAVGLMTREIAESAAPVRSRLLRMIAENTGEGQTVLVVGVGNTSGVPQ